MNEYEKQQARLELEWLAQHLEARGSAGYPRSKGAMPDVIDNLSPERRRDVELLVELRRAKGEAENKLTRPRQRTAKINSATPTALRHEVTLADVKAERARANAILNGKAMQDAPAYSAAPAGDPRRCDMCLHYDPADSGRGYCRIYQFITSGGMTCASFKPGSAKAGKRKPFPFESKAVPAPPRAWEQWEALLESLEAAALWDTGITTGWTEMLLNMLIDMADRDIIPDEARAKLKEELQRILEAGRATGANTDQHLRLIEMAISRLATVTV